MGLDTTHDCWHGSYRWFHQWRTLICRAAGLGDINVRDGFVRNRGDGISWPAPSEEPLVHLLAHSDCDGSIAWEVCAAIADRLERLELPATPDFRVETRKFIDGLRRAANARENVEFH